MRMVGERDRSGRRAFTVLELVLVMALISMLVGYVLPSFWGAFQAEALPTSAREMRALIYQVRANAMMEGLRYRIRFPTEDEIEDHPERLYQPVIEAIWVISMFWEAGLHFGPLPNLTAGRRGIDA